MGLTPRRRRVDAAHDGRGTTGAVREGIDAWQCGSADGYARGRRSPRSPRRRWRHSPPRRHRDSRREPVHEASALRVPPGPPIDGGSPYITDLPPLATPNPAGHRHPDDRRPGDRHRRRRTARHRAGRVPAGRGRTSQSEQARLPPAVATARRASARWSPARPAAATSTSHGTTYTPILGPGTQRRGLREHHRHRRRPVRRRRGARPGGRADAVHPLDLGDLGRGRQRRRGRRTPTTSTTRRSRPATTCAPSAATWPCRPDMRPGDPRLQPLATPTPDRLAPGTSTSCRASTRCRTTPRRRASPHPRPPPRPPHPPRRAPAPAASPSHSPPPTVSASGTIGPGSGSPSAPGEPVHRQQHQRPAVDRPDLPGHPHRPGVAHRQHQPDADGHAHAPAPAPRPPVRPRRRPAPPARAPRRPPPPTPSGTAKPDRPGERRPPLTGARRRPRPPCGRGQPAGCWCAGSARPSTGPPATGAGGSGRAARPAPRGSPPARTTPGPRSPRPGARRGTADAPAPAPGRPRSAGSAASPNNSWSLTASTGCVAAVVHPDPRAAGHLDPLRRQLAEPRRLAGRPRQQPPQRRARVDPLQVGPAPGRGQLGLQPLVRPGQQRRRPTTSGQGAPSSRCRKASRCRSSRASRVQRSSPVPLGRSPSSSAARTACRSGARSGRTRQLDRAQPLHPPGHHVAVRPARPPRTRPQRQRRPPPRAVSSSTTAASRTRADAARRRPVGHRDREPLRPAQPAPGGRLGGGPRHHQVRRRRAAARHPLGEGQRDDQPGGRVVRRPAVALPRARRRHRRRTPRTPAAAPRRASAPRTRRRPAGRHATAAARSSPYSRGGSSLSSATTSAARRAPTRVRAVEQRPGQPGVQARAGPSGARAAVARPVRRRPRPPRAASSRAAASAPAGGGSSSASPVAAGSPQQAACSANAGQVGRPRSPARAAGRSRASSASRPAAVDGAGRLPPGPPGPLRAPRPATPARSSATPRPRAWSVRGSRASPASTTTRTPGTVRLDSATDVASTTRRPPPGGQRRVLDGGRGPAVQLQHLRARPPPSMPGHPGDLADAGQEAQHVAVALGQRPPHDVPRRASSSAGSTRMPCGGRTGARRRRPHAPPPGARLPRASTTGAPPSSAAQAGGVGGRGGRDQPQLGPQRGAYVQQEGQRGVRVQVPFVALVEQDGVDARAAPGRAAAVAAARRWSPPRPRCAADTRRSPRTVKPTRSAGLLAQQPRHPPGRRPDRHPPRLGHQHPPRRPGGRRPSPASTSGTSVVLPVPGGAASTAPPAPPAPPAAGSAVARAGQRLGTDHAPASPARRSPQSRTRTDRPSPHGSAARPPGRRRGSVPLAHEDRRARAAGAPRSGDQPPHSCVVPRRPLRLDQVDQPEARPPRSRGPGRRACGGARRRPRGPARPARRRACGRSRRRRRSGPRGPARRGRPSGSGGSPRRPSGRPAAAPGAPRACTRAGVGDERHRAVRRAGQVEGAVGERQRAGVGLHQRQRAAPRSSSIRRACWSCRWDRSSATGRAPCAASQREHCAAPAPISSTPAPAPPRGRAARPPPRPGPPGPRRSGRRRGRRRARSGTRRRCGPTSRGWPGCSR